MGHLLVRRAGLLTTVQDRGRTGWARFGVPPSGAMDVLAALLANTLVGNAADAALLELTGPGAALQLDEARTIAVAGGDLRGEIIGAGQPPHAIDVGQPFMLAAGEALQFSRRLRGARAYLAIAGGLDVPLVFGSAATDLANHLGGWQGRPLRAGDSIALHAVPQITPAPPSASQAAALGAALYEPPFVLRFVAAAGVPRDVLGAFTLRQHQVTPQSNRTGFRLHSDAPPLPPFASSSLISEPLAPGTVQIPPDGHVILLMADRQTVGGYPIIGHVIAADLSKAAQLWPGDRVTFAAVDRDRAHALAREQAAAWAALRR